MKQKNRTVLVTAIAITVVAAVFVSFGVPSLTGRTPKVTLADLTQQTGTRQDGSAFTVVEVTPQTVQSVIATLARPDSYYREAAVYLFWQGGSAASQVQVWQDGGYTKTTVTRSGGATQNYMVGDGTEYIWYDGDQTYYKGAAGDHTSDLSQRIPTYEDVLKVDPTQITSAGYESKNGKDCIYVEVREDDLGYLERYWIETASGLLCASETESNGQVVYRMEETKLQTPLVGESFALPDGTVLHRSAVAVQ